MKVPIQIGLVVVAILLPALVLAASAVSDAARAQEIIKSQGCLGCHKIAGSGGTFGPALDGVGKRLSSKQIRAKLIDPRAGKPDSAMPSFAQLPPTDLDAVVDYLAHLK